MSEDDDLEDLPQIYFNSSVSNASSFNMPSAETVLKERASALERERELKLLHERHAADADAAAAATAAIALSDSSGSDSEAALVANAITRSDNVRPPTVKYAPIAQDLLQAFACKLPTSARLMLDHPATVHRLPELVANIGAMVSADEVNWSDDDVWSAGAVLAVAVLAHDTCVRAPALRALHTLLDYRASWDQAEALGCALAGGLEEPRARLQLSDALRSGAGAGADRLGLALLDVALLDLLGAAGERGAEALQRALGEGWRRLGAADGYGAVQLLGRRLAAADGLYGDREVRARLLSKLTPPCDPPEGRAETDAQRPERLKVLVGIAKLRLLFYSEKTIHR